MASRYWVGGTAAWDATVGTKWALTSGGAGGQAVPTATDDVFFDAASGAVTVTQSGAAVCLSLNFTGFTGTFAGSGGISIRQDLTLGSGMTYTNTGLLTFSTTVTTRNITCNGKTITAGVTLTPAVTYNFQDDFACTGTLTFTAGTLNSNNHNVTCGTFNSSNLNTRTINMGTGTWTCNGQFSISQSTGLTFNASTSIIRMTGGGSLLGYTGAVFYDIWADCPEITLGGTWSCHDLKITAPCTVTSTSAAIKTLTTLTIVGGGWAGGLVVFDGPSDNPTSGIQGEISIASGTYNFTGVAWKAFKFTGGATFNADGGDIFYNTGTTVTFTLPAGAGKPAFSARMMN